MTTPATRDELVVEINHPATRQELIEVMGRPLHKFCSETLAPLDVIADSLLKALSASGVRIVPAEATEEMTAATESAFVGVDACLKHAATHGVTLRWTEGKPPLFHAYAAMLAASPYNKEPEG